MKPLVVAKDVKKSFQHMGRTLEVLRGIDLVIEEGDMIGIVGQSGAGKSTLLHCMGTLDIVTSGSIQVGGEELTTMSGTRLAELRNKNIGFVFQFHHLLPEFSALENVVMPGLIQGRPRREMEDRAKALLEEVGLKERILHRPGELSGGEQQRVALARAFILRPPLLLADEPTGNLDSKNGHHVLDLLIALNRREGATLVLVTHDQQLAAYADRVITLSDGVVVSDEVRTAIAQ